MPNNTIKSFLTVAVMATSQVPADTPNNHATTTVAVRESGIDYKSKIAQIDIHIVQIQTKINIIEQKNDLDISDKRNRYKLNKELKKLTDEKFAIMDKHNKELDGKIAIKRSQERELDKQLSIADHKLEALNRIDKLLQK